MKEYSLWDICVLLFQWIGRCCTSCARLVVNMCSLSLRKWWVFLPTIVLFAAGSLWLTRPSNRWYKVNAVAVVNGPQLDIVKSRYASLNDMPHPKDIRQFKAYDVIDAKHDGSADYIDWKKKHNQTDTLCVRMERDRKSVV